MRMKLFKMAITLGIIMASTATPALAYYYSLGIGSGGKAEDKSLTLEIGKREVKIGQRLFLVGIGIPFINHADNHIPSETIGSPCPHSDYRNLGRKPEGIETGLVGKLGLNRFHPDLYLSVLGGMTRVHEIHLVQSPHTKYYYEQSSDNKLYGIFGLSVGYFPVLFDWNMKLNLQLDLDNRRGITGHLGWSW
jgi:hypothetical protein